MLVGWFVVSSIRLNGFFHKTQAQSRIDPISFFGADPDKGTDAGYYFLTFFNIVRLDFFVSF